MWVKLPNAFIVCTISLQYCGSSTLWIVRVAIVVDAFTNDRQTSAAGCLICTLSRNCNNSPFHLIGRICSESDLPWFFPALSQQLCMSSPAHDDINVVAKKETSNWESVILSNSFSINYWIRWNSVEQMKRADKGSHTVARQRRMIPRNLFGSLFGRNSQRVRKKQTLSR